MLDHLTYRFTRVKELMKDIFEYHFIDFYHDIKEIKAANDYSQYDGIPDIYKNDGKYDGAGDANEDDEDFDLSDTKLNKATLEKYWLSIKYKESHGFVEMLKIILMILSKVQDKAKLSHRPVQSQRVR